MNQPVYHAESACCSGAVGGLAPAMTRDLDTFATGVRGPAESDSERRMQRGEPTPYITLTYSISIVYSKKASEALEARRLVQLRDRWLNPPEWVDWVDEPVPGYPKRPVPRADAAAEALKKRTLTNLYNARPQWLDDAHAALDAAVASAYGWRPGISDEEALRELLAINCGGR